MPLAAHKTPRITVPLLDGNDVSVRGFNLDDLMGLVPNHFEDLSKVAALYAEHKESVFSQRAITGMILQIANSFPGLISEVISVAADEPDARDVKLSTGLQMSVLTAIVKLTVEEAGGLGNLFARLRDIGRSVVEAQAELRANNSNGRPTSSDFSGIGGSKSTS